MSSKYSHVFEPIRIRGVDFKNRIFLAPATPVLSTADGLVTPELVNWMRMFARGGATTLYLGNCSVDLSENKDQGYQLDLGRDDAVRELARYADMCKEYDCHASLEINHAGEGIGFETFGRPAYSSSSFISSDEEIRARMLGRDPIPCDEMSKEKIKDVIRMFADAAYRMKRAGMDIVMVHGGHGNLISQFTSPKFNKRTDEYGGSTENRARFAIELCDAIREKCGENFVIEYRCSGDEEDPEGMHIDETIKLAGLLKGHIDILHVSAGLHSLPFGKDEYYRNWCQNTLMPRCFNVHYARDIKEAHPDLLVNTVGSITSIDYAEEIISRGWADFVSMCRPLHADPDMPRKYAENRPEERIPCLRCDTCSKHIMVPKMIYCAVNPMCGMTDVLRDGVVPKAEKKKKVAVVGGGPGGIYAMMTLCMRGHDVTLYEASGEFGGMIVKAASPSYKLDMKDYLAWLVTRPAKYEKEYGAKILLNTKATKEMLDAENYDAVIIAIGADPVTPKVPGTDLPNVAWAPDAEEGCIEVGDKIVIVGGSTNGIESAFEFALRGKKVEIIEMNDEAGLSRQWMMKSSGSQAREFKLKLSNEPNIHINYRSALKEILPDGVVYENMDTGEVRTLSSDSVLLACGMRAKLEEAASLRHCAPETDVFVIGDAKEARTLAEATNEAFRICLHI